jgi:exopolysaccharide biosynthesis predicted pyruvyltransferase EpsI
MRLLPLEAFAAVFEPLVGKRIGFVRPRGNVGDLLIEMATFQLFGAFGIQWELQDPAGPCNADELVFGGGGNMGTMYRDNWLLREEVLKLGPPVTILPQSFSSREDRPFKRVYVRERRSLAYCDHATLAPDLALGLDWENHIVPTRKIGVFLRRDCEGVQRRPWFTTDPVKVCDTPQQYLELAARHERIITDRLHFAICGLIVGRDTTLLPNSYHKNPGMYEAWLRPLGCRYAASLDAARRLAEVTPEDRAAAA